MTTHNLTGHWGNAFVEQNGNQVTAMPDYSQIPPAQVPFTLGTGILVGNSLTMTFSGGGLSHPVQFVGTVSSDGRSISWSNGTVWNKN